MGTESGVESKKVKGAIFAKMWNSLSTLVVQGRLPEEFERKQLAFLTANDANFKSPGNLDEFLGWAKGREKILQEGDGAPDVIRARFFSRVVSVKKFQQLDGTFMRNR